ncbi:hypothetical protein OIU14_08150 [Thalassobacter stenotrophicus]|uniref:hypothetical protein n=1 Tax=Thalassobacter TaxID=266808 RepID=UPI00051DE932|nr:MULTISPECIES: hypothetical protein [Thalassobacter]KGL03134.1 hypothetical protein PM04_01795 [Thalassobacter sp. 16PALIMAR09]UYP69674.1 hypothetical protein OIU14_08150 [Thalassobacter stenotrophicus]
MRIEKAYYSLPEILRRWSVEEDDLIYLAENNHVRLSIRVFNQLLEFGDYDADIDGARFRVPYEERVFSGLLDLHASDVFQLFRCGEIYLNEFRHERCGYAAFPETNAVQYVVIGDLLMQRHERDRYEIKSGFHTGDEKTPEQGFIYTAGYREVRCRGICFQLGAIQAEVVRALHSAAEAGEPWQNGKTILTLAGSRSLKMVDVFKSKPDWRELIQSDRRGNYRLRFE